MLRFLFIFFPREGAGVTVKITAIFSLIKTKRQRDESEISKKRRAALEMQTHFGNQENTRMRDKLIINI